MTPKVILIVDDEVNTVKLLALRLAKNGYEVIACESGAAALEAVKTQRPDLAVLDLHLPYMNGYELIEQFRKNDSLRSMPVIFSTADAGVAVKKTVRDYSANDFVIKPYDAKDLLKKIEKLLTQTA